jgi:uncharacterized protein (TIGR00255 family)
MIASMTGFGRGIARQEGSTATVEMRSVNNRFCEVVMRLPRTLAEREAEIQHLVKQQLSRGRITVQIDLDLTKEEAAPVRVDAEAARLYANLLVSLREAAGLSDPVRLEHLLAFPEVLARNQDDEARRAQVWALVQEAVLEAVADMKQMRQQEGQALATELTARIDLIAARLAEVEAAAPDRLVQARARLKERLADLLADERLHPDRLEGEIALLADRLDITEECVRLRSHLDLFRQALASAEPVGRKLNFLTQEINREVNTIGSKANDATIAHLVVRMKEELEKIKEQIENIE